VGAFDTILAIMPFLAFIGLMLAVKFGKIANIYLFAVITIATVVLGVVSLSVIKPFDFSASTLGAIVGNMLAVTYIGSMFYGAWGVRTGNWERVIVAGMFVLLVSLVSAVI
jgi:hypothetical protein